MQSAFYACSNCQTPLFEERHRLQAAAGNLSFEQAIPGAVKQLQVSGEGKTRIQVICSRCGHLLGRLLSGNGAAKARYYLTKTAVQKTAQTKTQMELATFGNGCFWCTEAIFQNLKGVEKVISGYSGGQTDNPTYREVCTGRTGHAEVLQITYNPAEITFSELLDVFWSTHDPTTLNRQGNDVGTQYRSVIFYHSPEQQQLAEKRKAELDASGAFPNPIVTQIEPLGKFFPAEDYHQNYFNQHGSEPYCALVIKPKLDKFRKNYSPKLK